MKPRSFMLIAGETSGDLLAAELVDALRAECAARERVSTETNPPLQTPLAPSFFGAGGPRMAAAGVELAEELTQHAVIGLWEVVRRYRGFRRVFKSLLKLAQERQPDVIVCVDFSGFNRRFARAVRNLVARQRGDFNNWQPKIVQFVSPQVWASRPARAFTLVADLDLLLVTFPFERDWYAQRFPTLPVKFVGNPAIERHGDTSGGSRLMDPAAPSILLLPGSRAGEIRHHVPVVCGAARLILKQKPAAKFTLVVPTEELKRATMVSDLPAKMQVITGPVGDSLRQADLAITKSGTITLECALFGVPAVVFYKTSWPTFLVGRMLVGVDYISMPNLLAGREVYPEFVQQKATPQNLAQTALRMLSDPAGLDATRLELAGLVAPLFQSGASRRAAREILKLVE